MYFKDIVLDSNRKMQNVEDKILMLNLYEDCFVMNCILGRKDSLQY